MSESQDLQVNASSTRLQRWFLLVLALIISLGFLQVVRPYIVSLLMAAIFAGMTYPLYLWLGRVTRGRDRLAAVLTVLAILVLIIGPGIFFVGMLANEALNVSESVGPWIQEQASQPGALELRLGEWVDGLPFIGEFLPDRETILAKLGEMTGLVGGFLVSGLGSATRGTFNFILQLCIMLYANYFFLRSGKKALEKIMYVVPLESHQEDRLVSRFVSVTRATLKGTLVIGLIQGGLAGIAFAIAGISGALFWGTIMAVLSIIPAVGAAIVWVPAVIYLLATGKIIAGVGLLVWCGIVVGSSDNILRPILVGKDTKMPDLLVLLSTLGGIGVYGPLGIIIGPLMAALFLTVWELFGEAFRDVLPEVQGELVR
jgi:predicted PurR-regulated permease PerM